MIDLNLETIPMKYRPAPFWSWNEKLEPEELRRQIREMHRVGLGGFFMHARGGLQTEYLSDEWMDCVKACLEEAGKYGMQAWLYDENGWPSGFGGGLVNGLGLKYQQKYLRHEIIDASKAASCENTIAFYSADGTELLGSTLPAGVKGSVMRCFFEVNRYYVDNLDADVVAEFLRVTHQHYFDALPKDLLKNLRGIFTDEPQLSRNGLLWSFVLEEEYRKAYQKELLPELPLLFLNLPGYAEMRIRFWSLCAKLFTTHFMKQIREWCDAHHWELTGHHVLEETCQWQISSNGSVMAQYRYYNMPGVDHLGRHPASEVTATQMVSSAAQFGQKQTMTESFAMTGWGCHFSGMRWIYLQQMAHGINFLCPHLESYSLRGLRKRDYPASVFYHQPWWDDYAKFNDSVSRIGMILAEGEQQVDVLVLHPLSSAWKEYAGDERKPILNAFTQSLRSITLALDTLQINHHYADEYIVEETASVNGPVFKIGLQDYHAVIVPQLSNLSSKTAELLRKFAENGGKVYLVRDQNEDGVFTIDGRPAPRDFKRFMGNLPSFNSEYAAAEAAANDQKDRIIVTENGVAAGSIISTSRRISLEGRAGIFYYFVNRLYRKPAKVTIELPETGEQIEVLDPVTGKLSALPCVRKENGRLCFDCTFAPASDKCFFVTKKADLPMASADDPYSGKPVVFLKDTFRLEKYTGNLLTLDRCSYRIDGGAWESCDIIDLQTRLLARQRNCDLEMQIEFFCDEDFDFQRPPELIMETPERFSFTLNGKAFEAKDGGYLFDKAFRRIQLPAELKPGMNILGLSIRFSQPDSVYQCIEAAKKFESEYNKLTYDTELESVYLFGDFSVRHKGGTTELERNAVRYCGTFSLGAPMKCETVKISDLIASGLPFFSGKIQLIQTFELTAEEARTSGFLRMDLFGANSCKVRINGEELGGCFWEPFAWKIDHVLKEGSNVIELEFATSLRNMLGPHHLEEGESYSISTRSFNREPNVIGAPAQPYDPGYCFLKFGANDLGMYSK